MHFKVSALNSCIYTVFTCRRQAQNRSSPVSARALPMWVSLQICRCGFLFTPRFLRCDQNWDKWLMQIQRAARAGWEMPVSDFLNNKCYFKILTQVQGSRLISIRNKGLFSMSVLGCFSSDKVVLGLSMGLNHNHRSFAWKAIQYN